jgi:Ca2+/Na+ antiporter
LFTCSQDASTVGTSGLVWLFLSYGYVLYYGSNLISEGSELLLLVPELAGLVGGIVLPLLGAVPDGAIILCSGLGADAQTTLSVGVGALAGSTVMLLTVPFAMSIYAGRVDMERGQPNYFGRPKLTQRGLSLKELQHTGVTITQAVSHSGVIMMLTTVPYFLIQIPASFLRGTSTSHVAHGEHWWSLAGLMICLTGLVLYLALQLHASRTGELRANRTAAVKKLLQKGAVSLSGAVAANVGAMERRLAVEAATEYQTLKHNGNDDSKFPPPAVNKYLKEILSDAFYSYDKDNNGTLEAHECFVFFRDFHESILEDDMLKIFEKYDVDGSGALNLDEFIGLAYSLIKAQGEGVARPTSIRQQIAQTAFAEDDDEEEEIPADFTTLSPDKQQAAIKKRAFIMLACGTGLILMFSDPMVEVMQEIATRVGLSGFYVSFVLAPLASNASEVISSMYYASKKTRKTIAVSLSTLCGAAALNNTFCLSVFFLLIFFRGLAWQYSAETISIIVVEMIMGLIVQRKYLTMLHACFILSIFPLSLLLVATLEHFGFD